MDSRMVVGVTVTGNVEGLARFWGRRGVVSMTCNHCGDPIVNWTTEKDGKFITELVEVSPEFLDILSITRPPR